MLAAFGDRNWKLFYFRLCFFVFIKMVKNMSPMGSPLGPVVADMFMIWFEKYMDIIKAHGVVLWLRFVDDVFILIDENNSFDKANELMRVLNSKHPNIEFTMEKETNNYRYSGGFRRDSNLKTKNSV